MLHEICYRGSKKFPFYVDLLHFWLGHTRLPAATFLHFRMLKVTAADEE